MPDRDPLEAVFRRMGEPSWFILRALHPTEGRPGIDVIRRVERTLEAADYPYKTLDPSTLHYALKRMIEDGLVRMLGKEIVDVPGPRGSTRREERPVYVITGLGSAVLNRRRAYDALVAQERPRTAPLPVPQG